MIFRRVCLSRTEWANANGSGKFLNNTSHCNNTKFETRLLNRIKKTNYSGKLRKICLNVFRVFVIAISSLLFDFFSFLLLIQDMESEELDFAPVDCEKNQRNWSFSSLLFTLVFKSFWNWKLKLDFYFNSNRKKKLETFHGRWRNWKWEVDSLEWTDAMCVDWNGEKICWVDNIFCSRRVWTLQEMFDMFTGGPTMLAWFHYEKLTFPLQIPKLQNPSFNFSKWHVPFTHFGDLRGT